MSDIFDEVDESLRQDKMETWWKRYRPFVYGAAGLLIAGVALNEFVLRPQAEQARADRALAFEQAVNLLKDGEYEQADAALKALVDDGSRLSPLAAQYLAQARYEGGGDKSGAASALAQVAGIDGGPYARIALIKLAYLQVDGQTLPELEATLGDLVEDEGPLGSLARELIAAKAVETGDIARARREYNRLSFDAAAPEGLKRRASIALAALPAAPAEDTIEETDVSAPDAPAQTEETGQ